jgi:hypothetical protein
MSCQDGRPKRYCRLLLWAYVAADFSVINSSPMKATGGAMRGNVGLQPLRIPAGWLVSYNQLAELDPDPAALDREAALAFFGQDLLQFERPACNRLVDVGWYPHGDLTEGQYRLVVYEGDFRGRLLHEFATRSRTALVAELERVLEAAGRHPL